MPNWCNNSVEIYHDDPAMIERVRAAFDGEGLLQEFIPVPDDLRNTVSGFMGEDKRAEHEAQQKSNVEKYGYNDWYSFCVNEWGTKWDIGSDGNPAQDIPGGLMLGFESAWSPPTAAYEKLIEMGFRIRAMYYEPGMAFAGIWEGNEDEVNDDYYEYGGLDSKGIAEALPAELDEAFCISEQAADWEEENQEIDLDGGLSATNEQEQE
jgi:hypothetical protein